MNDARSPTRSAVVTGAAVGIGRAIAEELLAAGYQVAGLDRDTEALNRTAEALGSGFLPVAGDATSREDHRRVAATAAERGRLQVWINNAGIERPTRARALVETDLQAIVGVNLIGTMLGCATAVEAFTEGGVIVNVSSIHAVAGFPDSFVYAATKGGIDALTRQLAVEEGPRGIRCNAVRPGAVRTPLTQTYLDAAADSDALESEYAALHPVGRLIEPAEVACVVAFLASDAAAVVNGVCLAVDGGATARCYAYPPRPIV